MDAIRVLIIDDEVDFAQALGKRLNRRGLEVRLAHSGTAGIEMLGAAPSDVVILDVKMPGLNGIETLREIKRRFPEIEVIMLTGHASVESGVQGMSLGAYDYVMKPADLDELMEKIKGAAERKRLSESRH